MTKMAMLRDYGETSFSEGFWEVLGEMLARRAVGRGLRWLGRYGKKGWEAQVEQDEAIPLRERLAQAAFEQSLSAAFARLGVIHGTAITLGFEAPKRFPHLVNGAVLGAAWRERLEQRQPS